MPKIPVLPVANIVLPRPGGDTIKGILLEPGLMRAVLSLGVGGDVFVAPLVTKGFSIYHVGVMAKIRNVYLEPVYFVTDEEVLTQGVFLELEGRFHGRAAGMSLAKHGVVTQRVEPLDLKQLRPEYPVISSAGWHPLGGLTEAKGTREIVVSIYGVTPDGAERVSVVAHVGELLSLEEAHTAEHAIIRSLKQYGLCSPKTLITAWQDETYELKESIEAGFRLGLPELFGVTASGACGNPLTNLAQFYLAKEFTEHLYGGDNVFDSLSTARRKTLSRISSELDISSRSGLRVLQGLKRGMMHTDDATLQKKAIALLNKFPVSPWE